MCIYSVLLYTDFLIIVAVNLSVMTQACSQNTCYQLSVCMQIVKIHIKQSVLQIQSGPSRCNPTLFTTSGKQAQEVSSVSYVIPV